MSALLVGYARCSTDQQDLTARRDALLDLGVEAERIYVDHGLPGTNRERPGLREALAACRAGDTLVVTKLDRRARSLPDARAIADELTTRQISLSLGGSVYDPTDAVGRRLFNVLAMVAEFESDLIRLRTREGMKVAKAKGRLRGKQPKLNRRQEAHLASLVHSGEYSTLEVAELFGVGRATVCRAIERQRVEARAGLAGATSRHSSPARRSRTSPVSLGRLAAPLARGAQPDRHGSLLPDGEVGEGAARQQPRRAYQVARGHVGVPQHVAGEPRWQQTRDHHARARVTGHSAAVEGGTGAPPSGGAAGAVVEGVADHCAVVPVVGGQGAVGAGGCDGVVGAVAKRHVVVGAVQLPELFQIASRQAVKVLPRQMPYSARSAIETSK